MIIIRIFVKNNRKLLADVPEISAYNFPTKSLAWTAPDANGGTIDLYEVQLHIINAAIDDYIIAYSGTETECVIDVRYGIAYEVSIRARNEGGFGDWGDFHSLEVQTYIPEPPVLSVKGITPFTITFEWTEPYNNGHYISLYRLDLEYENGATDSIQLSNATFEYTVADLNPLETVIATVLALNEAGVSADSNLINQQSGSGPVLNLQDSNGNNVNTIINNVIIDDTISTFSFNIYIMVVLVI